MHKYLDKIRENKKFLAIFLAIMIVGIFLRVYNYSDLLRFGKDQARDASIITNVISNGASLPLLGPRAGGTEFKMGPIFYYFQYISASVFGDSPVVMAYPDLVLSLLTILLLLIFLRRYFSSKIALILTALYSVSFYAVQNGRFAWNPNSLPFFVLLFLYAFLRIIDKSEERKILWSLIAGLCLGVGFQMHTLYILILSITFAVSTAYLIWKKEFSLKYFIFIIFFAFIANIPQIYSEFSTNWENSGAFLNGIGQKTVFTNHFPKNILITAAWQLQANTMFVFPAGDDTSLHVVSSFETLKDNKKGLRGIIKEMPEMLRVFLGTVFSIFGYWLLFFYLKREKDERKKVFLKLVFLYTLVAFIVLVPLSFVLELRYFLVLEFIPFILLGFIVKFVQEKFAKICLYLVLLFISGLYLWNVYTVILELHTFDSGEGDVGIAIWGEEKNAGDFILANKNKDQRVYMLFEPASADKFIRPLAYFDSSIVAPLLHNDGEPSKDKNVAYFTLLLNNKKDISIFERAVAKSKQYVVTNNSKYGRLVIYKLELIK
jgi:4-amino-4-deoxy-L-arabinose transferase-like glycosyltransferase